MATTKPPTTTIAPRSSQETERRHLLSPSQTTTPAASILDLDPESTPASGQTTPRARSLAPTDTIQTQQQVQQPYRGFPSEAAYLEALRQWAESKKFVQPELGLRGFYGEVTMEEYAQRPGLKIEGLGLRKKLRARREGKRNEVVR